MYPYTVPDEIVQFIHSQFNRFHMTLPSPRAINTFAEGVIRYVVKNNYYPTSPNEAAHRYEHAIPLSEMEKISLIGPAEYQIKVHHREHPTVDQMHLLVWASLLWCWSKEGENYVAWFRHTSVVA